MNIGPSALEQNTPSGILVSFRLEGKDNLGKGAFWDHYTIQKHTGLNTLAIHDPSISMNPLTNYITLTAHNLPYSILDNGIMRPIPAEITTFKSGGLLVIPGMARDSDTHQPPSHQTRMLFETKLIQDSINRGRPIIAICAGSWKLWQTLGGSLADVTDHNYGGGMPRIGVNGGIGYNKMVHNVDISPSSLLASAMDYRKKPAVQPTEIQLPANSIHWRAPSTATIPKNFQVCATAIRDNNIQIQTRQAIEMVPDEGTVEAFESIDGAPILGLVWHPEAFDWNSESEPHLANHNALLYMAKAGQTFEQKQKVNSEISTHGQCVSDNDISALTTLLNKCKI
jgi:gamma-glutamyl-gamma-aminobutyrate hydrolase PuuD